MRTREKQTWLAVKVQGEGLVAFGFPKSHMESEGNNLSANALYNAMQIAGERHAAAW